MARGIGPFRCAMATLLICAPLVMTAAAEDPPSVHAQAVEQFRVAAVLQDRALYDLAAAEYAAIESQLPAHPLADRARLARGVCLFHLQRYAEAVESLAPLQTATESLTPTEAEQSLAYYGLAQYNLSLITDAAGRAKLLDAAIAALGNQAARFPHGALAPVSTYYHAEALYARGHVAEAAAAYRALLDRYPAHAHRADVLYALGVAEQERGAFAAAVDAFATLETESPDHAATADARSRRGDALLASAESQLAGGDDQAALTTVETLLREFPESALLPPALLIKAQVQLRHSDVAAAETALDECIARSTHADVTCQARLLRAQVRYRRDNFAGTLADAASFLAAKPGHVEALHLRGLAEAKTGRPADAARTFNELLAAAPKYARADDVSYDLAWAYQAANQPEHATATFARLAVEYPQSKYAAECHFRVGEAKYCAGEFAAAAECFAQACETHPSPELLHRALHKLAWCAFETRDYAAAETTFARQVAAQNGQVDALAADALHMIAECRFQQGLYGPALAAYDAAAPHSSASETLRAMTCVHAAEAAAALQNWQRAFELADRAVREFPASDWQDEARCARGVSLVELGRFDDAERDVTETAAKHQGLLQLKAELALAKIQHARHDDDSAVRTFFKVAYGHGGPAAPAAYHPLQAEAIYAAAQILEDTGRPDAAGKLYQELVDHYPASARSSLARQSLQRILRR